MATMRPMDQVESEFDDDVVAALQRVDEKVPDDTQPPQASDGADIAQPEGSGAKVDAPD